MLLLWRNEPCVVIGRHQNPWTESNVPFLRENAINLARRNSGGGTVYHDLGNLNCTFFTRRSRYNRTRNLNIICNAIREATALNVAVNSRDDIVLDEDLKISGTAAKLGKDAAYHHCTVLVDVNECVLHDALSSKAVSIFLKQLKRLFYNRNSVKDLDFNITTYLIIRLFPYLYRVKPSTFSIFLMLDKFCWKQQL